MKSVVACLFLAGIISSAYSACSFDSTTGVSKCDVYTQWTDSEGGAVASAKDCDFVGHDMSTIESSDQSCGKLCLNAKKCTHFTWSRGMCHIKNSFREKAEEPSKSPGDICGYIPERTDFVRVGK